MAEQPGDELAAPPHRPAAARVDGRYPRRKHTYLRRPRGSANIAGIASLWLMAIAVGTVLFFQLLQPEPEITAVELRSNIPVSPPRKTLIVVLDALRYDVAFDPSTMPFLSGLQEESVWGTHRTGAFPVSASFYKAFLAGRHATIWDVYNDLSPRPRNLPSWIEGTGYPAFFSGPASGFAWVAHSATADYIWYLDKMDSIPAHDQKALEWTVRRLTKPGRAIIFCHLATLDAHAHRHGGRSAEYRSAARELDRVLQRFASHLDPQRDVLIVASDHGVRDDGGHSSAVNEIVSSAPFLAHGPFFLRGRQVEMEQTGWPLLLASVFGSPLPDGYYGVPPPDMLSGPPAVRRADLIGRYRKQLLRAASLPGGTAALRRIGDKTDSLQRMPATELIGELHARAARRARLLWYLCCAGLLALTAASFKRLSLPASTCRVATFVVLTAGSSLTWIAFEWFWAGGGQLDGTPLDLLPRLRFHAFVQTPPALLFTCGLSVALVFGLRSLPVQAVGLIATVLCFSVLGLQRNRIDLLLYPVLTWSSLMTLRWLATGRPAPVHLGVMLCTLVAAAGQKLSYSPQHVAGLTWSAVVTSILVLTLIVVAVTERSGFFLGCCGVALLGCVARAFGRDALALVTWGTCPLPLLIGIRQRAADPLVLAGGACAIAPLLLPWPQVWPILTVGAMAVYASRDREPLREAGTSLLFTPLVEATTLAVAITCLLFYYGGGRDAYLPINEFYRTLIGQEVEGVGFSMGRAAVAVASRYLLYLCCGLAFAATAFPSVSTVSCTLAVLTFFGGRLSANALAFALFERSAWNYHLSLLFNDAAFATASAVLLLCLCLRSCPKLLSRASRPSAKGLLLTGRTSQSLASTS